MKEVDFSFYSDIGGRANNEDSYLVKRLDEAYLFIVADGLGGHADGQMASRIVVDVIKEYMLDGKCSDISKAIETANSMILEKQTKIASKMKSTVAVVYVTEDETIIAHVGDTRVYAFYKGEIVFQTLDHSVSQLAVQVGEIKQSAIRNHEDRNVLIRALGATENVKVEITKLLSGRFDSLLLCSDGFWEYVLENEMENALRESKTAEKWLYKMRGIQLRSASERCDNNTAIAIKL